MVPDSLISILSESATQIDDEKHYYSDPESNGNECKAPIRCRLNERIVAAFKMLRIVLNIYGVIPVKIITFGRSVIAEVSCIYFVVHTV